MREYPVSVPTVFHTNSNSASNIFDVDQYQRKLPPSQDDCYRRQPQTSNYQNNRNNYATLNGDLSHSYSVQNNNNHKNYNHSAVVEKDNGKRNNKIIDQDNTENRTSASYSILDAITNAVTAGNCSGTIYPLNEAADDNRDDRNYLTEGGKSFVALQSHQQQQPSSVAFRSLTGHTPRINNATATAQHQIQNRPHQFPSVNYKNSYLLWIGTPVAASFAVAIVIASLAGPQWLLTEEKIPNVNYNGTVNFNAMDDGVYVTKYTKSSLWILCFAQGLDYHCSKIDYFPKDEYSPDPNDSTMAIPYAIIKSTPFFLISGFILVVSYMVLMLAMCSQRHSVLFFFSGIFFIISGLIMLIGIIMYISLFKSEIGSKLRPKSVFQPPLFTYKYGHSFILFVVGCISAEIVGTLNFFLFIQIREIGREKAIPCFLYPRTPDKDVVKPDSFGTPAHFKCQKHPTVPKAFFSPFTQRRYFFEKPVQKCDVHQKNLAKSLNELYTEPAPSTLFPFDLPQEFPLTRSVSTTTDIFSNCSGGFGTGNSNSHKSLKTFTPQMNKRANGHHILPQRQHHHNDMSFDTEYENNNFRSISRNGSRGSLTDVCNMTKGILSKRVKSKDELFSEFCKKAGQRPKPKDIYFIDHSSYDDVAEGNVFVVENYATIRKNRRNSNANVIRKSSNVYNSNQSLKDTNNFSNNKKSYPIKNIFDVDSFGGSTDRAAMFLNNRVDEYLSQSRSNSRDSNLYQSRTLPRDFMKRNFDFFTVDHDTLTGRRVSASGLYTPYNNSMTLPTPMHSTPKRFVAANGKDDEFYKKSYDALASRNSRHCDAYTGSEDTLSVHWPNAIPGSPSSFSNRTPFRNNYGQSYSPRAQPNPGRMSSFYSEHLPHLIKQQPIINKMNTFNGGSTSENDDDNNVDCDGNVDNCENIGASNEDDLERGGDESVSGGSDDFGTFDLDRMEKERRKSHASLFEVEIDFENGTPV